MEEVRYHRQKEEEEVRGIRSVRGIRRAIRSVRDDFETRLIQIERRLAEQEQYTRLECVDFPENLKGEKLEAVVLNVFEVAGVPMEKRDFHPIHRLCNTRVVIAKVCNRRDAIAILRNKKKLRELSQEGKKKLKSQKIYVNESLCPAYKRILGKCKAPLKKKYVDAFYTINGKVKIKYGCRNGQETTEISHEKDLIEVFSICIMRAVDEEHEGKINPHN